MFNHEKILFCNILWQGLIIFFFLENNEEEKNAFPIYSPIDLLLSLIYQIYFWLFSTHKNLTHHFPLLNTKLIGALLKSSII